MDPNHSWWMMAVMLGLVISGYIVELEDASQKKVKSSLERWEVVFVSVFPVDQNQMPRSQNISFDRHHYH